MGNIPPDFWSVDEAALLAQLESSHHGLSSAAAAQALGRFGRNELHPPSPFPRIKLLLSQFESPIAILLIIASILSLFVGEDVDGVIILVILLASSILGYWQELRAHNAVRELLRRIETKTEALRDGQLASIPSTEIASGDVISLDAGSRIPADCRILEARDLTVDQSSLTGEAFPTEKKPGIVAPSTSLPERSNMLFMGSHVQSGSGRALVVLTGRATSYGQIADRLSAPPSPTEFEVGVRRFGYFLLEVAIALSLVVLAVNLAYDRPALESLLFTLALVVGMTPQLLPAIVTTTLAQGAHRMASKRTIVRRLTSIADLGGISVLCTDKTGTLTEGTVVWEQSVDAHGAQSPKCALFAYLNARYESGFSNVIDTAIRAAPHEGAEPYSKVAEIPYDFHRRMLSIVVSSNTETTVITKGAFKEVVAVCDTVEYADGSQHSMAELSEKLHLLFQRYSQEGRRCLAVAYRPLQPSIKISKDIEEKLTFLGLLTFSDPIKETAVQSMQALESNGITVRIVTGDNRFVAARLAQNLGVLSPEKIVTGEELDTLNDSALRLRIQDVDIFAEVDPNQKERIIRAFKRTGVGVGYLGDGINDAAALHAADVGISVDTATDVTKEAADIVLLDKDLGVLLEAVTQGRAAFGNTMKYILVTTSANFGNMLSVAGASFFADFLPLLPKQILLVNILSDLPAMAIATDRLDPELTQNPVRWRAKRIASFMLVYGLISSVFDYLTFGALLVLAAPAAIFRSSWFIESVISEIVFLLSIRTKRLFWRSRVGEILAFVSAVAIGLTVALPYSPLAGPLGFAGPPLWYLAIILLLVVGYLAMTELAKRKLN